MKIFMGIRYNGDEGSVNSEEVFDFESLPKEILRQYFEEWLEKSNGNGYFIVGNEIDIDEIFHG